MSELKPTNHKAQLLLQAADAGHLAEVVARAAEAGVPLAAVHGSALARVRLASTSRRGLVSNLYKGRVSRVLPGMQAAFLDIGLARTAFLHVADVLGPPPDPGNDSQPAPVNKDVDIRTLVR